MFVVQAEHCRTPTSCIVRSSSKNADFFCYCNYLYHKAEFSMCVCLFICISSSKTAGRANIKLGMIDHCLGSECHKVTPCHNNINFFKFVLTEKNCFLFKQKPVLNFASGKNFTCVAVKMTLQSILDYTFCFSQNHLSQKRN